MEKDLFQLLHLIGYLLIFLLIILKPLLDTLNIFTLIRKKDLLMIYQRLEPTLSMKILKK